MRNRRVTAKTQQITWLTILFILAAAWIGCILFGSIKAQAAPAESSYKYYTSIQVQKGDTLWNIADSYMTEEYADMNEYINEICRINHIGDGRIHAGEYLTIPYYSDVYFE